MSWRQLLGSHVLVATFWRQYPGENVLAAMVYRQPCPGINVPKATFQLSGPAGPDLAAPSWRPHPVTTSWRPAHGVLCPDGLVVRHGASSRCWCFPVSSSPNPILLLLHGPLSHHGDFLLESLEEVACSTRLKQVFNRGDGIL